MTDIKKEGRVYNIQDVLSKKTFEGVEVGYQRGQTLVRLDCGCELLVASDYLNKKYTNGVPLVHNHLGGGRI